MSFLEKAKRQEELRERATSKGEEWPKIPIGLAEQCWPELVALVEAAWREDEGLGETRTRLALDALDAKADG